MRRHDDAVIRRALEQQRRLRRRGAIDDLPMPRKPSEKDEHSGDQPSEEEKK